MKSKYIYEVRYHIFRRFPYFLCFFAVVFLAACRESEELLYWQPRNSVIDVLVCTLKGCRPYNPEGNKGFSVPGFFFLMEFMYVVFLSYGSSREKTQYEKTILVRYNSRENWWNYKTLWNITCAFCFTVCTFLAAALAAYLTRGKGFMLHENVWRYIEADGCWGNTVQIYAYCLILRFFMLSAFGQALLCLQELMPKLLAMLFPIVVLVLSAYGNIPCPGVYLMILRSSLFVENGVTLSSGIICAAMIFAGGYIFGGLFMRKKDIL